MTVMYTIYSSSPLTLTEAAQVLGLSESDLDAQFGVCVIDTKGRYVVLVHETAMSRVRSSPSIEGPFSNPSVGPTAFGTDAYPPRPSRETVLDRGAEIALDDVIEWLGSDYEESEREEILKQIRAAIDRSPDGYERCAFLERRYYWSPNTDLVDILDHGFTTEAHREMIGKWISDNDIKPQFAVGDRICFSYGPRRKRLFENGEIKEVLVKSAHYLVLTPPAGEIMVPYEDARPVPPELVEAPEATASAESGGTHLGTADATDRSEPH